MKLSAIFKPQPPREGTPKPCPFCGDKLASVKQCGGSLWLTCRTCGASGPEGDDVDAAIDAWNMRSGPVATTLAAGEDGLWRVG